MCPALRAYVFAEPGAGTFNHMTVEPRRPRPSHDFNYGDVIGRIRGNGMYLGREMPRGLAGFRRLKHQEGEEE